MLAPPRLRDHSSASPNMTPLVDVVMVILIFLMLAGRLNVGARFVKARTAAALTGTVHNGQPDLDVLITPAPDGQTTFRCGKIVTQDPAALRRELSAMYAQFRLSRIDAREMPVVLRPSEKVRYDSLIGAHQAVMRAGFENVFFAKTSQTR